MVQEDKIQELNKAQSIELSQDFYDCVANGICFNPTHSIDKIYNDKMSATVIVHHWNHAKFLPMLFESFEEMDRDNIDTQFIITDSGSNEENKQMVISLINKYIGKLNILFLYHNLDNERDKFNTNNPDGTFHGFPYISNSALTYASGEIHCLCDSSNIVNKDWLRGLCSPHYIYFKGKLIIKARGADFTAESTLKLENEHYNSRLFTLPQTYYNFEAGRGFGWSIRTFEIKRLGGFRHHFSSCGGVDDDFWYRAKLDGFKFFGDEQAFAIHRIHSAGYEINPRKPNWAYKELKKIYITEQKFDICIGETPIRPLETYKNY